MKVMKFGGGCLKNAEALARAAAIITSEPMPPVVVVSALSGVTDLLHESTMRAVKGERNVSAAVARIDAAHRSVIDAAIRNERIRSDVAKVARGMLDKVERLLYGIAYTGEITPATRCNVLSYGERFAALILSGVLNDRGRTSLFLESDKIGMRTDDILENATVDLSRFRKNFMPTAQSAQRAGAIAVVTGFFGCTAHGTISTFGRNGSDYSAAVIAYAVRAAELDIWKETDGFMSADPRLVKNARRIECLSYYEAAELSYFGARILHPRALEPLAGLKIRVCIKNMSNPGGTGTEITPGACEQPDVIKSVTYNTGIAILRIHGPGVGFKPGIIAHIGHDLSAIGINIYSIITSQTCINLLVDNKDARKSYDVLKKTRGGVIERVDLEQDAALIAVVGEGLQRRKGVAARIFSAVSTANVNIEMISSGASEVASYFIVRTVDVEDAVDAIHREFFQ